MSLCYLLPMSLCRALYTGGVGKDDLGLAAHHIVEILREQRAETTCAVGIGGGGGFEGVIVVIAQGGGPGAGVGDGALST